MRTVICYENTIFLINSKILYVIYFAKWNKVKCIIGYLSMIYTWLHFHRMLYISGGNRWRVVQRTQGGADIQLNLHDRISYLYVCHCAKFGLHMLFWFWTILFIKVRVPKRRLFKVDAVQHHFMVQRGSTKIK